MSTVTRRVPSLLLALAFTLSMSACNHASTRPSTPQTVSEVRCKQPATPAVSNAPAASAWVDAYGRLSEQAATWISEVLATLTKERKLRAVEHACLDDAERAGLIQQ